MSYQLRCDNMKSVSIITLCILVFDPDLPFKVETGKFFTIATLQLYIKNIVFWNKLNHLETFLQLNIGHKWGIPHPCIITISGYICVISLNSLHMMVHKGCAGCAGAQVSAQGGRNSTCALPCALRTLRATCAPSLRHKFKVVPGEEEWLYLHTMPFLHFLTIIEGLKHA
jgi:hypothetical protein